MASLNYYEILNCDPSDSIDDIKKSYQALALKHHPDKQFARDETGVSNDIEQFYRIDEAWKLLRDPDKRQQYDAEMKQNKFNDEPIVHARIQQNDFEFDSINEIYTFPCRCGGVFVLPDDCVEPINCDKNQENNSLEESSKNDEQLDDEIYIECDECSFVVQLLNIQSSKT